MGNKQDKSKRDEMFNTAYLEREDFELIWHGLRYSITDNVSADNVASDNSGDKLHQPGYLHGMSL